MVDFEEDIKRRLIRRLLMVDFDELASIVDELDEAVRVSGGTNYLGVEMDSVVLWDTENDTGADRSPIQLVRDRLEELNKKITVMIQHLYKIGDR